MNTIKTCIAILLATQLCLFNAVSLAQGETETGTAEATQEDATPETTQENPNPEATQENSNDATAQESASESEPQQPTAAEEGSGDDNREQDREQLRKMLAEIQKGLNNRDFDAVKPYLHDNVIITFLNAEMTKGISGAEQYMNKMFEGAGAILKGYTTNATVDQPAIFYGDVAVAAGYTLDNFKFTDDMGLELSTRWSTTVVKEGDEWKVAALHFSGNMFNNPILASAKSSAMYFALAGLVLGVLAIVVVNFLRRGKSRA